MSGRKRKRGKKRRMSGRKRMEKDEKEGNNKIIDQ